MPSNDDSHSSAVCGWRFNRSVAHDLGAAKGGRRRAPSRPPRLAVRSAKGLKPSLDPDLGRAARPRAQRLVRTRQALRSLPSILESRRVPTRAGRRRRSRNLQQAQPEAERDQKLTQLFASVLAKINTDRTTFVIGRVEEFQKRQRGRAQELEREGRIAKLKAAGAGADPKVQAPNPSKAQELTLERTHLPGSSAEHCRSRARFRDYRGAAFESPSSIRAQMKS